jgi:hypothetical protein
MYATSNTVSDITFWLQVSTLHLTELALYLQHNILDFVKGGLSDPHDIATEFKNKHDLEIRASSPIPSHVLERILSKSHLVELGYLDYLDGDQNNTCQESIYDPSCRAGQFSSL